MKKLLIFLIACVGITSKLTYAKITTNMQSNATLNSMCNISAIPSVNVGQVFTLTNNDSSFPVTVKCSKGLPYTIFTNQITENSPNPAGQTSYSHKMIAQTSGNTDYLVYNIYRDSGYSNQIGNGSTVNPVGSPGYSTVGLNGTGTGSNFVHNIYLRQYGARNFNDPLRGFATPDTYIGNLTFTLTY